jgi:hypothetical protein
VGLIIGRCRRINARAAMVVLLAGALLRRHDAVRFANCRIGSQGGTCRPTLLRSARVAASAIANSTFHGGK